MFIKDFEKLRKSGYNPWQKNGNNNTNVNVDNGGYLNYSNQRQHYFLGLNSGDPGLNVNNDDIKDDGRAQFDGLLVKLR